MARSTIALPVAGGSRFRGPELRAGVRRCAKAFARAPNGLCEAGSSGYETGMGKASSLLHGLLHLMTAALICSLPATTARAAAPGDWSVAVERLFGISRSTSDYEPGGTTTSTSVSLLSKVVGDVEYSAPRLAFDYLATSGITFGGAFGYESLSVEDADTDAWLLAGRIGYFARVSSGVGIWPRAGVTHVDFDAGDMTALTLEVPIEFLIGRGVALTLLPHADIGLGGSIGSVDRTVTEIGLQFGMALFL
jgi:hypothetical protein